MSSIVYDIHKRELPPAKVRNIWEIPIEILKIFILKLH